MTTRSGSTPGGARRVARVFAWAAAALVIAAPATGAADDIDQWRKELRGPDVGKAIDAARQLGEEGSPRTLAIILDELAVGAPPKVGAALLAGLAGRKEDRAVEVLILYTKNRNPELRKKAVQAVAELKDARALPVLIAALSDPVGEVRAVGAHALGDRKEKSAIEPLLKLLVHKDGSAIEPLGALGGPEVARQLGELIGTVPDGMIARTLAELLRRPDFGPEPIRVEVVKALGRIPSNDAAAVLKDYIAAEADKAGEKTRPSKVEAQKVLDARGGG